MTTKWLTPEQFKELWDTQGLKYSLGDLYQLFCQNGLCLPFNNFLSNVEAMLKGMLVRGERRARPEEQGSQAMRWWERIQRRQR